MLSAPPVPHGPEVNDLPIGESIYALASELFPICRSLTGQGVRLTLEILADRIDLLRHAVPSGTQLFDWTVPLEWNIRDAFIRSPDGRRVLDFRDSNLHVVSYSVPVHRNVELAELRRHIFTLPEQPDLIPYRTCYHSPQWGFCMAHKRFAALPEGTYEVCIDSELKDGHLDYGEYVHKGSSEREFLLSAHICHPSLANDNCSGLAVLATVAERLARRETRYTYRFLFAPATIGALAWLFANEERIHLVDHGLVVSCVGDAGGPTYKRSRCGKAFIDRVMGHLLGHLGRDNQILPFSPYGYDERQFCSPGFDMPVGLLQNSAFGTFPEYHTSADNLDFIRPEHLARSYRLIMDAIDVIEEDWVPRNMSPKGEPQLGRRGLYGSIGGASGTTALPILWVLNLADGSNSLLDIAERSGLHFRDILRAAAALREVELLEPVFMPRGGDPQ